MASLCTGNFRVLYGIIYHFTLEAKLGWAEVNAEDLVIALRPENLIELFSFFNYLSLMIYQNLLSSRVQILKNKWYESFVMLQPVYKRAIKVENEKAVTHGIHVCYMIKHIWYNLYLSEISKMNKT